MSAPDEPALRRQWFSKKCELLREELRSEDAGELADSIPELAKAPREGLGIAAVDVGGSTIRVGDAGQPFTASGKLGAVHSVCGPGTD